MMIDSGHDPLQVVCDHAHERGFNFLAHLLLNMAYTPPNRVTNGRVATYNTLHPEWIVGEEPDYPEAVHDNPNRMSYAVPEIRENRLAIVRELVTDYPTDGIDLNFNTYIAADRPPRGGGAHGDDYRVDAGCPPSGRRGGRRRRAVASA